MADRSPITAEYVRSRLDYDPETGIFAWKPSRIRSAAWNSRHAGKVAGSLAGNGYRMIHIDDRLYYEHHLAWLVTYGALPSEQIDHRDRDRTNNRIANLRPASQAQNSANASIRADNKSGFKGVSWCRHNKKWIAKITASKRQMTLGYFDAPEEAAAAYAKAAKRFFGEFAHTPSD